MSYDQAIAFKHLQRCASEALRGSRWKPSVQSFALRLDVSVIQIIDNASKSGYTPMKTNNFTICERGKIRKIKAHPVKDRAFYKSWVRFDLLPQVSNRLLECNSASQEGKGTDHAISHFKRCLEKAIRRNNGADFYVITADYHDYFGSIPHCTITNQIQFEDYRSNKTLKNYLNLFPGKRGIGIGGEPSQVIAIAYTSVIDRTMICNSPVKDLGRYMDDCWMICDTKEDAQEALRIFVAKSEELGLTINEKRTKINHMTHDTVLWLKKRTHIDRHTNKVIMQLTRKNVRDCIRRIHKNKELLEQGVMTPDGVMASMQCWASYAKRINANKQLIRVLNEFGEVFDVPWEVMRWLLRKNAKGWVKICEPYFRKYSHKAYS